MKKSLLGWLAMASLVAWGQPENPYAKDIAARWLTVAQASGNTKDSQALEVVTPVAVLQARKVPFQDLAIVPNQRIQRVRPKASWDLPPFATIGPPQEVEPEPQAPLVSAPVFAEVGMGAEAPSPLLRPRAGPRKLQAKFKDFVIPDAVSRVCFSSNESGLCQFSLYGGTNSFFAEQAYNALQAALDSREELKGFGQEAVLGVYHEPVDKPPSLAEPRFDSIEVTGKARPDQVDPGLNKARQAPAFKDVSTQTLANAHLDLSKLPSPRPAKAPRAPRVYWVVLAYFPDKAVTAEILLDQRLGSPQNAVDMAALVQTQIKTR